MHLNLDLSKDVDLAEQDSMRPHISVWHDYEDTEWKRPANVNAEKCVVVAIGPSWGAPQRFLNMTPSEARQLARMLARVAEQADRVEVAA